MNNYTLRFINPFHESNEVYLLDQQGIKTRLYKYYPNKYKFEIK